MSHVMYKRFSILFQAVAVLATASMRQENQEAVVKQMRKLSELISPEDKGVREEQETMMKDALRREGAKSYKVRTVKLG
jgi:hypothetical protein